MINYDTRRQKIKKSLKAYAMRLVYTFIIVIKSTSIGVSKTLKKLF